MKNCPDLKNPVSKGRVDSIFAQMQNHKGIPESASTDEPVHRALVSELPGHVRSVEPAPAWCTLIRFAEAKKHVSAEACEGLCFHEAIVLARYASQLGLADRVRFLCWDVRGDAKYRQHWALLLDDRSVLDPTGVQVDGSNRLIRAQSEYPGTYLPVGKYPVSTIVGVIDTRVIIANERYPKTVLWRVFRSMARHDIRAALAQHHIVICASSIACLCRQGIVLVATHLLGIALARLHRILQRSL